jgi:hypothetical protein
VGEPQVLVTSAVSNDVVANGEKKHKVKEQMSGLVSPRKPWPRKPSVNTFDPQWINHIDVSEDV